MKILPFIVTENEAGVDLDKYVKNLLRECGVELACPCPDDDCGPYTTVNDDIRASLQLLAQRVLDLEARVTLLE
jgi:hypothetical protein